MTKMASHESSEDSAKSPVADEANMMAQSKTDEKKSSTASLPVDQPSDTPIDAEEKTSASAATDDYTDVQKNDSDSIKRENKDEDVKPVIDKSKDDDKTEEQEMQDLALLADPQNEENEEKEVKNEDNKDSSTKGGSVKRKRKPLRLVQTCL